MYGSSGARFQTHGFNMEDIFSQFGDIFGGFSQHYQRSQTKKGRDLRVQVQVTLADVISGSTKKIKYRRNVNCQPCNGKGGTDVTDCSVCQGTGQRTISQQTPFGRFQQTTPCNTCAGSGRKVTNVCKSCQGQGVLSKEEIVEVNIPAGIGNGMNLSMQGQGNFVRDGLAGDLIIVIQELQDSKFIRQGNDLYCEEWISIADAVLGTEIELISPTGNIKFKVAPGTESGKIMTASSKGIPNLAQNGRAYGNGDLHMKINVTIPKNIGAEEREIFEKLKNLNK
jgi:molecular chaperone DnaJ